MIGQITCAWAVMIAAMVGGAAAATYPDLVLDTERKVLRAEYLPSGSAAELQFTLFQEKDGRESMLQTVQSPAKRGQRAHVEFAAPDSANCIYRIEVRDGGAIYTEVLNLYNANNRTPQRTATVSRLLDVPLALIGGFLDRYLATLMDGQGTAIWRVEVESRKLEQVLTLDGARILGVAPSPNGKTLVWVRAGAGDSVAQLWIGAKGAEARKISAGQSPVWSADGVAVFFIDGGRLRRFDLQSGAIQTVRREEQPVFDALLGRPGGSPSNLLASSRIGSESRQIWLVSTTDGVTERVTYDPAYLWLPNLSPQRDRLANSVYGGSGSGSQIVLQNLAGGTTAMTDGNWNDTAPSWSADGNFVYFVSNRR